MDRLEKTQEKINRKRPRRVADTRHADRSQNLNQGSTKTGAYQPLWLTTLSLLRFTEKPVTVSV